MNNGTYENEEEEKNNEAITEAQWSQKTPLERTLSAGVHGTPELKKEEKRKYLGQFRERIIKALTLEQIHEEGVYPEIVESIKDHRASVLIVSKRADLTSAWEYILTAQDNNLDFTTVSSPSYKGEIGLVVVSHKAVDEPEIMVLTLREKLLRQGIPEALADAHGHKVCSSCHELIRCQAPAFLHEYHTLNFWDTLTGKKCPACNP